jgi:hypothetical protein
MATPPVQAYAPAGFPDGLIAGGMTIAPANATNDSNPADPANNPTVITFADGSTQATSAFNVALNLAAQMAVIFGG